MSSASLHSPALVLRWIVVVLLAVAVATGIWRMTRSEAEAPVLVSLGEVEVRVAGPGTVQARVPVSVSARIAAQVVALHADHGDPVSKGALLAVLDDREPSAKHAASLAAVASVEAGIAAAEASLARARAEAELARTRQRREAQLYQAAFISQASYDASVLGLKAADAGADNAQALLAARRAEARTLAEEARYAQAVRSHTRIHAPMDGLVIQRAAEVGSTVAPGTTLFRLVDPSTLWVAARIDEALSGRLEVGMKATIRLRNGETHAGTLARISRQSDAATRELEVNVSFDTPPQRFSIDQEAEVSIAVGVERGPAVPVAALVRLDGRVGVHVLRGGRRVFQPVRIAAADARVAIVAEGLAHGTQLAAWTSR